MTLNGAIMQLVEIRESNMVPVALKPYFDKVIETISECVEPSEIPHWIPVTERPPEEDGLYIVTNVGRWVEPVGTRYYNIRADGGFWSGYPSKVLAWMPLPAPYRKDGD